MCAALTAGSLTILVCMRAVSDIIGDMETVIDGKRVTVATHNGTDYMGDGAPLVRVYSGHDSTLLPLLAALQAHDGRSVALPSVSAISLTCVRVCADAWSSLC
jgi:hypothetical protein